LARSGSFTVAVAKQELRDERKRERSGRFTARGSSATWRLEDVRCDE